MKQYRWPEPKGTKFVPEAYVYDQIGVRYSLYCTNEVFEYKEYMSDGITRNVGEYKQKNIVGYLYNYVSKLDDVLPNCEGIAMKRRSAVWKNYWKAVRMDKNHEGPRVKRVTLLGQCIRLLSLFM